MNSQVKRTPSRNKLIECLTGFNEEQIKEVLGKLDIHSSFWPGGSASITDFISTIMNKVDSEKLYEEEKLCQLEQIINHVLHNGYSELHNALLTLDFHDQEEEMSEQKLNLYSAKIFFIKSKGRSVYRWLVKRFEEKKTGAIPPIIFPFKGCFCPTECDDFWKKTSSWLRINSQFDKDETLQKAICEEIANCLQRQNFIFILEGVETTASGFLEVIVDGFLKEIIFYINKNHVKISKKLYLFIVESESPNKNTSFNPESVHSLISDITSDKFLIPPTAPIPKSTFETWLSNNIHHFKSLKGQPIRDFLTFLYPDPSPREIDDLVSEIGCYINISENVINEWKRI